jgi:hypothetical protein
MMELYSSPNSNYTYKVSYQVDRHEILDATQQIPTKMIVRCELLRRASSKLAQRHPRQRQMVRDGQLHPNSLQEAKFDDYKSSLLLIESFNYYYAATTKCSSSIVLNGRAKTNLPAHHVSAQLGTNFHNA